MNIAQLPHKISSALHQLIHSTSDNTSTVSAAIGGAGGGVTFLLKQQYPQLAELVLHTGSICLYSAVGAITGVLFKVITERIIKRIDDHFNKNKSEK